MRLGNALCSGIGGSAAAVDADGIHFAYRPLRPDPVISRNWRPAELPDGRLAAFHGYFDNAAALACELGCDENALSLLYGLAVDKWGEDADRRIIGEYCAIIVDRHSRKVRLARSPLRAPPLAYHHSDGMVAAASVPRAILATGLDPQINMARAADSALLNFTDEESTWFHEIARVPLGSTVELEPGRPRVINKYYNLLAMPDVRMASDAEYIARANELLDEGVRLTLAGCRSPGSTLSSGLDSAQVVARAIKHLPPGTRLPTFTFHPEDGWDGIVENTMNGNERPMVEAFVAQHPEVEPHFTANEGYEHDHRWNEFFHLMGGAPSGLCNMYVFHGLFTQARARGCDMLLLAEWGNFTFSDLGDWGYVEYFLTLRWRQLWRALTRKKNDGRSLLRKFIALCIVPLMPNFLWKPMMHIWHPGYQSWLDMMTPLSRRFRDTSGAQQRFDDSGLEIARYHPRTRRHAQALLFQNQECEASEIYQAFEQLYGIPQRDPTAYRPLVEFCFGLPVELFMRDGEVRWLAKQMAKGVMPEEQRTNRLNGRWDSDWHLRITRRREDYLRELDSIEGDEELSAMFDVPRLRAALKDLPDHTTLDRSKMYPAEFAVPRGLLTARFINYVKGTNRY